MPSKPHNTVPAWLVIKFYHNISWRIPNSILRYYVDDPRARKRLIKKIHRVFLLPWFYRLLRVTVYRRRPCNRRLRFIGQECKCDFFRYGQVYRATSFNGATYTIYGYRGYMGYAHFDRL